MQFLAHLPLGIEAVSVIFCQNDPGMCGDREAASGANRAFVFTGRLVAATVPAEGETLLRAVTALRPTQPARQTVQPVLGRLGGEPDWLQGNETPDCPCCTTRMTFTAELEEGTDFATSADFGGSSRGYIFQCHPCSEAAFLWQRLVVVCRDRWCMDAVRHGRARGSRRNRLPVLGKVSAAKTAWFW
jgi:hypothetical protein